VKIPAGVETGNRMQLSGQGEVGAGGGPAGDLYVEMIVEEHEYLLRDGDNLHIAVSVPMTAAALGSEMNIETLDGEINIEIKSGTQSGDVIAVKGKGMTKLRGGGRGDLYAHVSVEVPSKLSKKESDLLKEFAKLRSEDKSSNKMKSNKEDDQGSSGFFGKFKEAFRN
jgi:molecular chaperone DnaJ